MITFDLRSKQLFHPSPALFPTVPQAHCNSPAALYPRLERALIVNMEKKVEWEKENYDFLRGYNERGETGIGNDECSREE